MAYATNSSALTKSDDEPNADESVCKDVVDEATRILDLDATLRNIYDFNTIVKN